MRFLVVGVVALAVALFVPFGAAGSNAHASDKFFEGLEGSWQGRGLVRTSSKSPQENIRCRLINALAGGGERLRVSGNCLVAGFMLPVTGFIIAEQKSAYSATIFRNLAGIRVSAFSGKRRGSTLKLRYVGVDIASKQKIDASVTIAKRKNNFDISLRTVDPETRKSFNIGTIKFQPR